MNKKEYNLSENQLKQLKKEISESLSVDRYTLVCDFPFTGAIAMRLELIPIRDKRCLTACTDGKSIYFDCNFYTKLSKNERLFVLCHEIWHCVMLHLSRKQSRINELFNIAADMETNNLLIEHTFNSKIIPPDGLCFPPNELKGKSAEIIYEWLLKQNKKQNSKNNSNGFNHSPNISDKINESDKYKNNNKKFNTNSNKSNGNNNKSTSNKDKSNDLTGQFDKHVYIDENDIKDNDKKIIDQWGEVGYDNDFNPKVDEDTANKLREIVTAATQQYERERGEIPAGISGIINKIYKSEISWYEVLAQFVTSCYGGKRRWLPPNRRHVYNETYFQSRRNEIINIIVALDTSGSCINDLPKFFGELKGLVDSFGSYIIHLIQCDAAVSSYEIYDDSNPLEIDCNTDIKYSGGGGTSFSPVFNFIKEKNIEADCLIYLTDGFGDAPTNPPNYPTLWILTNNGNTEFCNWGRKIKFKNSVYDY